MAVECSHTVKLVKSFGLLDTVGSSGSVRISWHKMRAERTIHIGYLEWCMFGNFHLILREEKGEMLIFWSEKL